MSKYSELTALGIVLKRSSGVIKTTCPKCSHTRKKKTDPCLSVDIDKGVYKCHNCDWKGGVGGKPEKIYTVPTYDANHTNLPDKVVEWMKTRGIKQQTALEWKIGYQEEWMPQTQTKCRVIAFNYFLDGTLINQKFRTADKHFKMVKDARLIFYGLDTVKDHSQPVVICEGEMDALSIWQSGFTQVLSVPNGATKGAQLEYLDYSMDLLESVERFIIWTDNDDAGLALRKELIRRIGEEKCDIVQSELKDANEVLMKHGETEVEALLKAAKPAKITGIVYVNDIRDELLNLYENGLPSGDATGIPEFDKLLTFENCRLTTITGIPSHGKSEFVDFVLTRLACFKDWKFAYYSPENYPRALHLSKLIEKVSAKSYRQKQGFTRITQMELERVTDFLNDRVFMINPEDEDFSIDSILAHAKKLVRRNGINALVIDPFNKLEHTLQKGELETTYISRLLDKLTSFAQHNLVHIFLIAHPTKMRKREDGSFEVPTLYDISGSAHFYNKTDNGFTVYRDFDSGRVTVHVQKVKFKHIGQTGQQEFHYDLQNGRYYIGGQDQTSWITPPEQSALTANNDFLTKTNDDDFPF